MLSEAAKDARSRAKNILRSAGNTTIGKLVYADMGAINIDPANSTRTSNEGNNDTTAHEKDIITIVHATSRSMISGIVPDPLIEGLFPCGVVPVGRSGSLMRLPAASATPGTHLAGLILPALLASPSSLHRGNDLGASFRAELALLAALLLRRCEAFGHFSRFSLRLWSRFAPAAWCCAAQDCAELGLELLNLVQDRSGAAKGVCGGLGVHEPPLDQGISWMSKPECDSEAQPVGASVHW